MHLNFHWILRLSFFISLVALFGSLYFSEILNLPPCVLCWYQRICLYPLVIIFATGLLREDPNYRSYASPLLFIGTAIAVYHNLLYYGIVPASVTPCRQGVSCTTQQIEYLGFITIPLLSLLAFLILGSLTFINSKTGSAHEET